MFIFVLWQFLPRDDFFIRIFKEKFMDKINNDLMEINSALKSQLNSYERTFIIGKIIRAVGS